MSVYSVVGEIFGGKESMEKDQKSGRIDINMNNMHVTGILCKEKR
jgi:hypothetical protein